MPPQHERGARPRRPGLPARRRWGQNFLANPATAEKIVAAARVGPGDTVLEIGPGDGALTRPLARTGARVVAVEIDPLRARALATEFSRAQGLEGAGVRILQGDVLARPFAEWLAEGGAPGAAAVLVANLPYNVATPILTAALDAPETIRRSVATVQREVARRFVARPGDEAYGFLSVRAASARPGASSSTCLRARSARARRSSRACSSSCRSPTRPTAELARRALCLASLGFNARRKTLPNALSSAGAAGVLGGGARVPRQGPARRAPRSCRSTTSSRSPASGGPPDERSPRGRSARRRRRVRQERPLAALGRLEHPARRRRVLSRRDVPRHRPHRARSLGAVRTRGSTASS